MSTTDVQKVERQPSPQSSVDADVAVSRHEKALLMGDLSKLSNEERSGYYADLCDSLDLNPLTRPFDYIQFRGELKIYANKSAAAQLRKNHGISITDIEEEQKWGLFIVRAYAETPDGRTDRDKGVVSVENKSGEALANAIMKAQTKAKRRVTFSICGLGFLDETEAEDSAGERVDVDPESGEILNEGSDDVNEALGLGDEEGSTPKKEEVTRHGKSIPVSAAEQLDDWDDSLEAKGGDELEDALQAVQDQINQWPNSTPDSIRAAYKAMLGDHQERLGNEDEGEGTRLPEGINGRNFLMAAGVETIEQLQEHVENETLEDLDGIGSVTAKAARNFLNQYNGQ